MSTYVDHWKTKINIFGGSRSIRVQIYSHEKQLKKFN